MFCKAIGYNFHDLDSDSLGSNGLVKRELVSLIINDHHYRMAPYIKLLFDRINFRKIT